MIGDISDWREKSKMGDWQMQKNLENLKNQFM